MKPGTFEQWCFRDVPPHTLALVRIIFGLWLMLHWGRHIPRIPLLFSDEGIGLPLFSNGLPDLILFILTPPPAWTAWILFVTFYTAILSLTVGFLMRASIATILILYAYYWAIGHHVFFMTFERLFIFTLIVLLFSGADQTLSLRMRLEQGSFFAWKSCSILPQRLLGLQLCATYLGVVTQKFWLPGWQGGEILAYSLIDRWGTPLGYRIGRMNLPIEAYDTAVYTVKLVQFVIPFGFWWRRYQWWFFLLGLLFHLGIFSLLSMWWFLVMVPMYIVFLEPEEVYKFVERRSQQKIS